jgi:CDP-paratose 2-epimerase
LDGNQRAAFFGPTVLGGGRGNSCSIREAFALVEACTGRPQRWRYSERHRTGDHVCYYSDLSRLRGDYPRWDVTRSLEAIVRELAEAWRSRLG